MGTEEPTTTANQPRSEHHEEEEYNHNALDDLVEMGYCSWTASTGYDGLPQFDDR